MPNGNNALRRSITEVLAAEAILAEEALGIHQMDGSQKLPRFEVLLTATENSLTKTLQRDQEETKECPIQCAHLSARK
jgi:hypothetical protein